MLSRTTLKTRSWNIHLSNRRMGAMLLICVMVALPALALTGSISDSDITYWVKDALRQDARVDASAITVNTTDSIVVLSGSINNLAGKKYADMEAKKIDGVLGVVDRITVSPSWYSDTDICNAVRRRILNSAVIESQGISVNCVDGTVTLSGKVDTYSEDKEAELLASEVRGVKEVKDNIMTEWTTNRSDPEIKGDAVAALNRDVYLTDLPITVIVKNGVVTLTGSVGSVYEKDRTRDDVRWVRNVKSVENNLKVEWWENRGVGKKKSAPSDAVLKKTVRDTLDQDTRLNASGISIKVFYGSVTLDGSVYSHYEKRIAEQDARDVVGVAWVTNNLFSSVDKRQDWAICDDVKFNLDTDATTEGFDINVKVKDGIVTLSGGVYTWYERLHAENVASRVKGVKEVIDQITTYKEATRSHPGAAVAKNIKERFEHNWTLSSIRNRIDATVKNGVATLTGDVDTWAQRREAESVAFNTQGIWKVNNRLTVNGYNYNWQDWYQDEYGPYYYPWYVW